MKIRRICAGICLIPAALLTGCGGVSEEALQPMMGLAWFTAYDDAKTAVSDLELVEERTNSEGAETQYMMDLDGAKLFETDCSLTLCFTESGLIGFNYHDTERNQSYRAWFSTLEEIYGYPTEEGSGMASWYQNPLGKNTALYLFNLEEGVQISFYATESTPDQAYETEKDDNGEQAVPLQIPVLTPELRTPIVPVEEEPVQTSTGGNAVSTAETTASAEDAAIRTDRRYTPSDVADSLSGGSTPQSLAESTETTTVTTETAATSATTTASSISEEDTTVSGTTTEPPPPDRSNDFKLSGLEFYMSAASGRTAMAQYSKLYEYRFEEQGQPWELIMEYEGISYCDMHCDAVLSYTSLGLVGINFFDYNASDYSAWITELTEIYGAPNDTQYDYAVWSSDPVGSGTVIYVFALGDGVQISFFADDTGSALS